ncbi:hypothetical protein [Nocardioides sp.]|uniref:hypothetical protein n=1 Tax=Nocardioides sp. TaxID=35761 RepID=UPI002ED0978B
MTGSGSPPEDLVIVHDLRDDSVYEFSSYVAQPDGSLLIGDHLEGESAFYRVDGERLSPVLSAYGTVERLMPTDDRNLAELRTVLAKYASQEGIVWDGADPMELVLAERARDYANRWPRWPNWLDRWMHGSKPG